MGPEQTAKQQTIDLLRQSSTLVVTTTKNPTVDDIAGVIGLRQMLDRMGKRVEAVVSGHIPAELEFLPTKILHKQFMGIRDFVIELNTSKTEADKLKYIPEDKRLKIFITPFNGTFTKEDLGFSYGDYHCDGLVALGVNSLDDLDPAVASQHELLNKTRIILAKAGPTPPTVTGNTLAWSELQATSICEMLMSLTEALQSGLLDNHLSTALLTGIVAATNHFTAPNTTPKVMTMAAQLMAAGADQATIVGKLTKTEAAPPKPEPAPPPPPPPSPPQSDNELKPSQEKELPHHQPARPQPPPPPPPPHAKPQAHHRSRPPHQRRTKPAPPRPPLAFPSPATSPKTPPPPPPAKSVVGPPSPFEMSSDSHGPHLQPPVSAPSKESALPISDIRTPLAGQSSAPPPLSFVEDLAPAQDGAGPMPTPPDRTVEIEKARKAVEEATKNAPPPPLPGTPPPPPA